MRTKCAAYLRVSGKDQVSRKPGGKTREDGYRDGFPRQRERIALFAALHGWSIEEEFVDEGVSGTVAMADREGLMRLAVWCVENNVNVVIVESADRLARDHIINELIVREFQRCEIKVFSAAGGIELTKGDQNDPDAKAIRQLLAVLAELEKDRTVLRLRAARARVRHMAGRCEGQKPYGSRPGEECVVQRIKQLHRKPKGGARPSLRSIAATLNAEGILTRSGNPWQASTIRSVLRQKP